MGLFNINKSMRKRINFKLIENSKYNEDIQPSVLYLLREKQINYKTIAENEELILLFFVEVAKFDFFKKEIKNKTEYNEYRKELKRVLEKTFSDVIYICHLAEIGIIKRDELNYSIFEYMLDVKHLFSEFFRFTTNKSHYFIKMQLLNSEADKLLDIYFKSI